MEEGEGIYSLEPQLLGGAGKVILPENLQP